MDEKLSQLQQMVRVQIVKCLVCIAVKKMWLPQEMSTPLTGNIGSTFFFVDPPHLIKTVYNCWANLGPSGT